MFICFNAIAEEVKEEKNKKEEDLSDGVVLPVIVISPTKYETDISGIPSSISVIGAGEIELSDKPLVKDVLKYVPGVDIVETSAFGGSTSIYIRGTESRHTVVMIDGIRVFDPMSIDGSFNLSNLTLDNVERVEILKGPQSTVYGSGAIGGVVDIITKKGEGKPRAWVSFEGGSFATLKEAIGSEGEMNGLSYSATVSRIDTKGISKADEKFDNHERDPYHNTSISGRVDYDIFKNLTIGSTFRRYDAEIAIDDDGGYGGDDPNHRNREINTIVSAYANAGIFEWWDLELKWLWMKNERYDKDKGDDFDPGEYLNSNYKGKDEAYQILNILKLTDFDTLSAGIDYDRQEGDSFSDSVDPVWGPWLTDSPRVKNHNVGYYMQNKVDVDERFHSIAGFRIDDHSEFGVYPTYNVSGKYTFDWGTSIKGSWSTGFKAPSLFQSYDPTYGNTGLKSEESRSFEVGLGQDLFENKVKLESTFFHTNLKNLIDFGTNAATGQNQYVNIGKARIYGLENAVIFEPVKQIALSYSYSYLNTRNEANDQMLNRRPRNKHAVSLDLKPLDNLSFNMTYLYVGGRKDVRFAEVAPGMWSQEQINLKHYNKVDVSGRYVINKYVEVFGRVDNLLNQFYEEVDGYGMPGIAFYGGCKATF